MQNSADDPYKRPLRPLEYAQDWHSTISKLSSDSQAAIMVCGPKNSGKSTFCRLLTNALLLKISSRPNGISSDVSSNSVAYLDLDPGQPEYSPPGELSLHVLRTTKVAPPFTHPTVYGNDTLIRAHHYGYLSPKEDPDHYYECALDLVHHYKRISAEKGHLPMIVNCSGWIQGSGLDLLANFVQNLDLTNVIYMSTSGPDDVVETLSETTTTSKAVLHQLSSQGTEIITRTAADLRMMQTLSYFHLDEPDPGSLRWNSSTLASMPPLVVHYAGPKQGVIAVNVLGDEIDPDILSDILNGCIVGIVVVENNDFELGDRIANGYTTDEIEAGMEIDDGEQDSGIFAETTRNPSILRNSIGIPYLASRNRTATPSKTASSHSVGQALIRGIDPIDQTFHILTPISPSSLQSISESSYQSIVLVRGKLDTPTWAYAEQSEYEKAMRRRREEVLGTKEEGAEEAISKLIKEQPWMEAMEDGGRKGSGKVRRIRRDLRYKPQGQDKE